MRTTAGDVKETVRQQLQSLVDRTRGEVMPPLLAREGELMARLQPFSWVIEDWRDATRGRRGGMDGPWGLDHQRLYYWRANRDFEVSSWEIEVLLRMDENYLAELLTPAEDSRPNEDKGRE